MYNKKDATETLEIFTKALGAEAVSTHDLWAESNMTSAHFILGELRGSAAITSDLTPGSIRVAVWRTGSEIVRVTAPAAIALAAVNMAVAQNNLDTASE